MTVAMRNTGVPDNNFDFLRFALAALVVVSHSFMMLPNGGEPLLQLYGLWSTGDLAVNGFFIISGFLITHSWLRSRSAGDYVRKRALRIYPGFIVAMILCGAVVLPLASHGQAWLNSPRSIGAHVIRTALLQRYKSYDAFTDSSVNAIPFIINGSTWTIFYELLCYLLTPAIVALGVIKRPRLLLALLAAFLAGHAATSGYDLFKEWRAIFSIDPIQIIRFFAYYLAGVTFYVFRDAIPRRKLLVLAAVAGLALVMNWRIAACVGLPILMAYIIFAVAFSGTLQLRHFARHGDFSYGIYIYAGPIQQLIILWGAGTMTVPKLMGLSMAGSILAGFLSWHLVEKHFLKLKRRPAAQPDAVPVPAVASA